jgi:hypothetical protein
MEFDHHENNHFTVKIFLFVTFKAVKWCYIKILNNVVIYTRT